MEQIYFTTEDDFYKIISKYTPNYQDIIQIPTGWTNYVFKVKTDNGSYIYRFPRNQFFSEALKKEIDFNHYIQDKITLKTPKLFAMYDKGRLFSLHKLIEGQSLTECFDKLSPQEITTLTDDLCQFIKNFQEIDHSDFALDKLSLFLTNLAYVNKEANYDFNVLIPLKNMEQKSNVLVHGDLNPGNLILKNNKLIAVIDFAFVSESTEIIDLSRLIGRLPKNYKEAFYDSYKKIVGKTINDDEIKQLMDIWTYVELNYIDYIKKVHKDIILPPNV